MMVSIEHELHERRRVEMEIGRRSAIEAIDGILSDPSSGLDHDATRRRLAECRDWFTSLRQVTRIVYATYTDTRCFHMVRDIDDRTVFTLCGHQFPLGRMVVDGETPGASDVCRFCITRRVGSHPEEWRPSGGDDLTCHTS